MGLYAIYCIVAFSLNRVDKIIFYNIILLASKYSFNQCPVISLFTFLLAKISIAFVGNYIHHAIRPFKKPDGDIFSYLRSTLKAS